MPSECDLYLCASTDGSGKADSSTVFFVTHGVETAEVLCRLLAEDNADADFQLSFYSVPVSALPIEQRVRLDEVLEQLEVYSDPDTGIYDPAPAPWILQRAQLAVQAARWERQVPHARRKQGLNGVLRAIERHRLMFLYWAQACRRNPLAASTRTGVNERVVKDDILGWQDMVWTIDNDGEFLWTHRGVLDRFADAAIETFGPGDGVRPTGLDAEGRSVPVDGGTHPYWILDDGATPYLEQSSDDILGAVGEIAALKCHPDDDSLLHDVIGVARPESHPRWYTNLLVPWSYLTKLDSLIKRLKHARTALKINAPGKAATSARRKDIDQVEKVDIERPRTSAAKARADRTTPVFDSSGLSGGRLDELLSDANLCLKALGELRRDFETMESVAERMEGGGEEWHFVDCRDEHDYKSAQGRIGSNAKSLIQPMSRVLGWGNEHGIDVAERADLFMEPGCSSGVRAEICGEYELGVRTVMHALLVAQAKHELVTTSPLVRTTEIARTAEPNAKRKPRMKRQVAFPLIAEHLCRRPNDSILEVKAAVGCSVGMVAKSPAWKANQVRLKQAMKQGKEIMALPLSDYLTASGDDDQRQNRDHKETQAALDDALDEQERETNRKIGEYKSAHPEADDEEVASAVGCTAREVERREAVLLSLAKEQRDSQREDDPPADDPQKPRKRVRKRV